MAQGKEKEKQEPVRDKVLVNLLEITQRRPHVCAELASTLSSPFKNTPSNVGSFLLLFPWRRFASSLRLKVGSLLCAQALITEVLIREMVTIYIPGHKQMFQKKTFICS